MSYEIGAARAEITPDATGVILFGWGDFKHRAAGVATPLYARAISIQNSASKKRLILVCLDLGFISEDLHDEVVARLGLRDDEIIISATHTHSAPGGFSSFVLYGVASNGFIPKVFETYVSGTVQAIRAAIAAQKPGEIRFATGEFDLDQKVAFNRSVRAYNLNPEVKKVSRKDRHLAVDRELALLRFDALDGTPIAAWNWFPVHGTSMHRNRYQIHSDNKGLAAQFMDEESRKTVPGFVSVFAQGAAGDVSPNFTRYFGLREKRGAFRDDDESCKFNANLQSQQALKVFAKAKLQKPLAADFDSIFEFYDFSAFEVHPDFVDGQKNLHTGPAEIGMPQLYGTAEGRGATRPMIWLMKLMVRISQLYNFVVDGIAGRKTRWPWSPHPAQGSKITFIESGRSMMLETSRIESLILPAWTHPVIATLKKWARIGILKQRPLSPQILPLQLNRIGNLLIASVPSEFTTISGKRLRRMLEDKLKSIGIDRVIIQGYANAYSGYVTTPEEYTRQGYEGGCTHFGRWTLPAYLTAFREMAERLANHVPARTLRPERPSAEYLKIVEFHG
jgi:neutral ceramidase